MPLPSVCRSTHSRNFSFGTTMRFPIRREGNPFSCISSYPLEGDTPNALATISAFRNNGSLS